MHGHHHIPGPMGRGVPPLFGMAGRLQGLAGATGGRARRGDVRTAILRLLSEQPMHGYQIIHELAERSGGAWNPSAGLVYPTLQLLADEGLVDSEPVAGKKVYSLTDAGRAAVGGFDGQSAPWEDAAESAPGGSSFRQSAGRLMQAVWQVGTTGTEAQWASASAIMDSARKQLYALLASD